MWKQILDAALGHVLIVAVFAGIGLLLYAMARRGRYPTLAPPEGEPLSRGEWRVWGLVGVLACSTGVAGAFALYATPPLELPNSLAQYSPYTDPDLRFVGPALFGLSFGLVVAPTWIGWFVRPDRLQHMLWREAKRSPFLHRGDRVLDPRPIYRWIGSLVATSALVVHFAVRQAHFALTNDAVHWCDWPWEGAQQRAWGDVSEVQLVRYVQPLVGQEIDRTHLRLHFRDGEFVTFGKSADDYQLARVEQFAGIAVERTGRELQRVDR